MGQTATMPRRKNTPEKDRHKPSRMVRVRDSLAKQLDILADRNASDFTEEVNRAIRELLEREKLWPPESS